jgi:hypothetical protein
MLIHLHAKLPLKLSLINVILALSTISVSHEKFIKFWRVLWLRINVLAIVGIKIVLNYSDVVSTSGNAIGKTVVNSSSSVVPPSSTRKDGLGKSSKYFGDFFGLETSSESM